MMLDEDLTMERDYTCITMKNENGTYSVGRERVEMTADDIVEQLVIPLLLAAGYSQKSIDAEMGRGE